MKTYKCKYCTEEFEKQKDCFQHTGIAHQNLFYEKRKLTFETKKHSIEKVCLQCGDKFFVIRFDYAGKNAHIPQHEQSCCSKPCARIYSSLKYDRSKKKPSECVICKSKIEIPITTSHKIAKCDDCRKKHIKDRKKNNKTIYNYSLNYKCITCNKPIKNDNKSGYCIDHIATYVNQKVVDGTHKGWQSRHILSYPEKFFKQVLEKNGLIFAVNHPIKQNTLGLPNATNYFLDFYFQDKNIDLEIDGKQHAYPDRVEHDKKRDEALSSHGYNVYRVKWKNPVNDKNKQYLKEEIDKFLDYYNSL